MRGLWQYSAWGCHYISCDMYARQRAIIRQQALNRILKKNMQGAISEYRQRMRVDKLFRPVFFDPVRAFNIFRKSTKA